jgi:NADP-dependent 3-hydroxy acid dehydrogenase YdfG
LRRKAARRIRSICLSPGEVETPILNTRPVPPTAEERSLMLQPEDVAEVALFCATLPRRACVAELVLLPTDDRLVRAQAQAIETLVGSPPLPSPAKSFGSN